MELNMSIKKQYLKSRPVCKVTFRVNKDAANSAKKIFLVGEFNQWDDKATPMNRLKSGDFTKTVELDTETSEYQFRYLTGNGKWENDWEADKYIPNGIDGENSVVRV
jgi:1,4-alpha-glucan branching enzyme